MLEIIKSLFDSTLQTFIKNKTATVLFIMIIAMGALVYKVLNSSEENVNYYRTLSEVQAENLIVCAQLEGRMSLLTELGMITKKDTIK